MGAVFDFFPGVTWSTPWNSPFLSFVRMPIRLPYRHGFMVFLERL